MRKSQSLQSIYLDLALTGISSTTSLTAESPCLQEKDEITLIHAGNLILVDFGQTYIYGYDCVPPFNREKSGMLFLRKR